MNGLRNRRIIGCICFLLTLVLSSCQGDNPETTGKKLTEALRIEIAEESRGQDLVQQNPAQREKSSNDGGSFKIRATENIGCDNRLFSESFYKAGNIKKCLAFSPVEGEWDLGLLEYRFASQDEAHPNYYGVHARGEFETEPGKRTYTIILEHAVSTCRLSFDTDGFKVLAISVEGDEELAGDYYPFGEYFTYPDVYRRYLSKADLCMWSEEDLRLLRNEIYAAHGRIFNDKVLNEYFSGKPWYRAMIEPEEFSEALLSEVERKNIAFIREMEKEPDRSVLDGRNHWSLEDLPFAPYLSWLGRYHETMVDADLSQAEDMGAYYIVHGSIFIPASLTQEEFETVKEGGTAKITTDELTGDYQILQLEPEDDENLGYGYLLYTEGSAPEGRGSETGITLNFEEGVYHLWHTSADTVMKRVYEGDIYILKGAVTGIDVSIAGASQSQKEIIPPKAGQEREPGTVNSVFGNNLCYNVRGHFTGIYSIGD